MEASTHTPSIRSQLSMVAVLRWRLFINALRSTSGRWNAIGSLAIWAGACLTALVSGLVLGIWSYVLASGTHSAIPVAHQPNVELLSAILWLVFLVSFVPPLALLGTSPVTPQLLRFPLRFETFALLSVAYGLAEPFVVTGIFWTVCIGAALSIAQPAIAGWVLVSLLAFIAVTVLLTQVIVIWLERWLATRRAREWLGVASALLFIAFQLIPRYAGHLGYVVSHRTVLVSWAAALPPMLAASAISGAMTGSNPRTIEAVALLTLYAAILAKMLLVRLRATYRGELLAEAPAAAQVRRGPLTKRLRRADESARSGQYSGVRAVVDKEFIYMRRSVSMLFNAFAGPLLIVLIASQGGTLQRHGPPAGYLAGIAVIALAFATAVYNSLGYDGAGVQLYFTAPVRFREVLLGKNLAQVVLFAFATVLVTIVASVLNGPPDAWLLSVGVSGLTLAFIFNALVGNLMSIYFPVRVNLSRFQRKRVGTLPALLMMGAQGVVIAISVGIAIASYSLGHQWIAVPVLLTISALAAVAYWYSITACERLVNERSVQVLDALCREG